MSYSQRETIFDEVVEALRAVAAFMKKDVDSRDCDLWSPEYDDLHALVIAALSAVPPVNDNGPPLQVVAGNEPVAWRWKWAEGDFWKYCDNDYMTSVRQAVAEGDEKTLISEPLYASPPEPHAALRGDDPVTQAAAYLAKTVKRFLWSGLRPDGRAADRGFDPWQHNNARQEDYRDVVREVVRLAVNETPVAAALRALETIRDEYGPNHGSKYCRDIAARALENCPSSAGSVPEDKIYDLLYANVYADDDGVAGLSSFVEELLQKYDVRAK